MSWYDDAKAMINEACSHLPESATYKDRVAAISAAYTWGRYGWPYKMWLKARKEYLFKYGASCDRQIMDKHLTPLELMMKKGGE